MTRFGMRAGVAATGLLAAGVLGLAVAPLASAAPPKIDTKARAQQLQQLLDCRALTDSTARLGCYDKAAAAFDQAEAKGDIVVVDRAQVETVRHQAFGFTLPSLSFFDRIPGIGGGDKAGEAKGGDDKGGGKREARSAPLDSIASTVASAHRDPAGKWIVKLEDGAVWAQVDADELPLAPKPGEEVRIRKATMGSYLMTIGKQRAIKAHRVE